MEQFKLFNSNELISIYNLIKQDLPLISKLKITQNTEIENNKVIFKVCIDYDLKLVIIKSSKPFDIKKCLYQIKYLINMEKLKCQEKNLLQAEPEVYQLNQD